jgi:uncharacterized membrane protein YcaP (DUF421 family)
LIGLLIDLILNLYRGDKVLASISGSVNHLLAQESSGPSVLGALLRAVVVYGGALLIVRLGEKRFLGKSTAFDMVVAVMLGSVVSRGIDGSTPLLSSLAAGAVLVGLHWLTAAVAFRSDRLGNLLKGHRRTLIKDGELQWDAMRKSTITHQDLLSGLRDAANLDDPEKVSRAYLERSGDISVVKTDGQAKVIEIKVEDGVQTVRVLLNS